MRIPHLNTWLMRLWVCAAQGPQELSYVLEKKKRNSAESTSGTVIFGQSKPCIFHGLKRAERSENAKTHKTSAAIHRLGLISVKCYTAASLKETISTTADRALTRTISNVLGLRRHVAPLFVDGMGIIILSARVVYTRVWAWARVVSFCRTIALAHCRSDSCC